MVPSITQEAVYTALRSLIIAVLAPATPPVVKGLGNRVSMPDGPSVYMTALFRTRLATNIESYTDTFPDPTPAEERHIELKTRFDIQLDVYGPDSGDWATILETVLRDPIACTALAPVCQPLYCDDARMIPLTTGEQQYLERWSLTATLQYNPTLSTPQDFAGAAEVALINVDVEYPP